MASWNVPAHPAATNGRWTATAHPAAEVYVPRDLDDALTFLAAEGPGAIPVAGGTNLLVDQRIGRVNPRVLVDISRLPELAGVRIAGQRAVLGALTTIRTIEQDPHLAEQATALVEAARVHGSVQTRGMATLGGNLCNATPSAETVPPLLVHDAEVTIVSAAGERTIGLPDLLAGPNLTTLRPGEILASAALRLPRGQWGSCYLSQTARWAMDLSGASVAAGIHAAPDGTVADARIALGAVGPTAFRVTAAEQDLIGVSPDPDLGSAAGLVAAEACAPISDARGSVDYRRRVIAALVPRALRIAWLRATGRWPSGTFAPINGVLPGAVQ